jgi:hypothetical protein
MRPAGGRGRRARPRASVRGHLPSPMDAPGRCGRAGRRCPARRAGTPRERQKPRQAKRVQEVAAGQDQQRRRVFGAGENHVRPAEARADRPRLASGAEPGQRLVVEGPQLGLSFGAAIDGALAHVFRRRTRGRALTSRPVATASTQFAVPELYVPGVAALYGQTVLLVVADRAFFRAQGVGRASRSRGDPAPTRPG